MSTDNSSNKSTVVPANDSAVIEEIEAWLIERGWKVNRFDYELTPSCAEVDYRNKTFRSNIKTAYYCAQVFKRVKDNVDTIGVTTVGGYLYVFGGGETRRVHDGGSLYQHQAMAIHPVSIPGPKPVVTDELTFPA